VMGPVNVSPSTEVWKLYFHQSPTANVADGLGASACANLGIPIPMANREIAIIKTGLQE